MGGKYIFGVDIGGSSIKIGLFNQSTLIKKWLVPTDLSSNGENIIEDICRFIEERLDEEGIPKTLVLGVGVGVPGPVDRNGIVRGCTNLGWGEFSLNEKMEQRLNINVRSNNDASLAALGESWQGGESQCANMVFVTLGTGVGGGIIYNNSLVCSKNGSAGEIGHIMVNPEETQPCTCGNYGCVEQYASVRGIVNYAKLLLTQNKYNSSAYDGKEITPKLVFEMAKNNDALAIEVVENVGRYLGLALSSVANVLDPDVILIGGGISYSADMLIDAVEKHFKKYAFHTVKGTKIALASLGNDAGMYGGAKLFL